MRYLLVLGLVGAGLLAGCSDITVPVAAIGDKGEMMKGTSTAKVNGEGQIVVSGVYGKCTGNYIIITRMTCL